MLIEGPRAARSNPASAAKYPELTISWVGQSQPMTEFAMELFPPMLMCLPLAFTVLIILVVLAFAHHSTDGKLVLPLALADLLDPALVFLVANLAVMATFGISCLLFPYVFFGHIFGASIGLAIGIDGMLVMHSYLRVPLKAGEDPREGFIERFASGAVAVTFTSLSTAIAFLATSISVFRMAIEIGICCAIAVGFNWLYIVTFFGAACAYLDTKPKSDRRFLLQGFFETSVTSVVSSTAGKALIFSVFVALLGGGIASFSKVQKEAGFEPVFDSEASTLVRWQYAAYRHFGDAYTWNATLVLASPDIDYSDAATRSRIDEAVAAVGESEFIDGGSVDSWLSAFLAEGGPLEPSDFYATLATWLTSDSGRRFADDVELAADGASIIASRIRFTQSAAQWGDAFPVYVAAVETTAPFADLDARLFADEYIVYELDEYNKLAGKIAVCVGTAGILVALLLFFHPLVAFVTAVSIFCIELMTVPFVLLGGIRIGPAVVFSAGAAFGLASDNIVHMLHAWSEAVASGHPNPVQSALSLVGHPLLLSGISTAGMFASFMPLVWPVIANIKIAYTLSFIFLAFVSVQLFFGLLLVPAVLHSIGGGGGGGGQAKPAMV